MPRRDAQTSSHKAPRTTRWAVLLLGCCLACASGLQANTERAVTGSARDANTNEPLAGAWVFEYVRRTSSGADVADVARARITRTDASGRFSFRREAAGIWASLFGDDVTRRYALYDPSYGLVRVRRGREGEPIRIEPSLRDAHLRQADAADFCRSRSGDAMSQKMREVGCPPARASRFADGSPRAMGELDDRGRREGPWTFFRADGSVIASGEYRSGGAVGDWQFNPPTPATNQAD